MSSLSPSTLSPLLLTTAVAFAYYVEMPPALNFLLNGGDIAHPFISVKKYVDFTTRLMLVTVGE